MAVQCSGGAVVCWGDGSHESHDICGGEMWDAGASAGHQPHQLTRAGAGAGRGGHLHPATR